MRAQLFLFVLFAASSYGMQGGGPKTFATADEARDALIQAAQEGGPAINQLFGAGADKLLRSGDEVLDKNHRDRFVKVARDKAIVAIDEENPDRAVVLLGELEWPFPVPLVRKGGRWLFDLQQGKVEIRNRLIGGNELDAIEVCRGYVEAQYQYAESDRDGNGVPEYAQRIISSPGKKDGLYWPSPDSPIAEAVAKVVAQGYKDKLQPFHGYHFKVLTRARCGCLRRSQRLRRSRHDARWIRLISLARRVRRIGYQDFHRQP